VEESTSLDGSSGLALDASGFAALGDRARLEILRELGTGTRCACELAPRLGMAQNLLSYHLRVLREGGLIEGSRLGRRTEYRIRPAAVRALMVALMRLAVGDDRE
jgi:DNA-binding transcriptional ArsR family regulator